MQAKTFAILAAILIFCGIINQIRLQKMTFRFSILWLAGSALVLFLAFNDGLLSLIAKKAGFELTSNFIFFLFLCFTVLVSLCLTLYINEQTTRTERLVQSLGILELKLRKWEEQQKSSSKN